MKQNILLKFLLGIVLAYSVFITWVAREVVNENNKLVYELNVSHVAVMVCTAQVKEWKKPPMLVVPKEWGGR